jgi:hypothetical protein
LKLIGEISSDTLQNEQIKGNISEVIQELSDNAARMNVSTQQVLNVSDNAARMNVSTQQVSRFRLVAFG